MCLTENNLGPKYFKGDNLKNINTNVLVCDDGVSFCMLLTVLVHTYITNTMYFNIR